MRLAARDSTLVPSSNAWGIADLDPAMQPARVTAPLVAWGSVARTTRHGGTWHFYVDDRRFSSPRLVELVARTEPAAVVEPNFSVFDGTSRAEALWSVARKRRITWELGRRGVPVFVDVCMPEHALNLALLGVPIGWRAYATRGFEARPDDVALEYDLALERAEGRPLFLVVGGGRRVREIVATLPGAIHCPDHMAEQRRRGTWAKAAAKAADPEAREGAEEA